MLEYGERIKTYLDMFPLTRRQRLQRRAALKKVGKRALWSWKKGAQIFSYTDQEEWFSRVLRATGDKSYGDTVSVSLRNRRKIAQIMAHLHFVRFRDAIERAQLLFDKQPPQVTPLSFSVVTKKKILLLVIDMTEERGLAKKLGKDFSEVTSGMGFLNVPLENLSTCIRVPAIILPFQSLLDQPEYSWKSFIGTKKATERLFADRAGIHAATVQLVDSQIEANKDKYMTIKMIAVHDKNVIFTSDSDVVHSEPSELIDVLSSRVSKMPMKSI